MEKQVLEAVNSVISGYTTELQRLLGGTERRIDIPLKAPEPHGQLQYLIAAWSTLCAIRWDCTRFPRWTIRSHAGCWKCCSGNPSCKEDLGLPENSCRDQGVERAEIGNSRGAPQISPLRYAPVEMTILLGNETQSSQTNLSSRPERSGVERSAVSLSASVHGAIDASSRVTASCTVVFDGIGLKSVRSSCWSLLMALKKTMRPDTWTSRRLVFQRVSLTCSRPI